MLSYIQRKTVKDTPKNLDLYEIIANNYINYIIESPIMPIYKDSLLFPTPYSESNDAEDDKIVNYCQKLIQENYKSDKLFYIDLRGNLGGDFSLFVRAFYSLIPNFSVDGVSGEEKIAKISEKNGTLTIEYNGSILYSTKFKPIKKVPDNSNVRVIINEKSMSSSQLIAILFPENHVIGIAPELYTNGSIALSGYNGAVIPGYFFKYKDKLYDKGVYGTGKSADYNKNTPDSQQKSVKNRPDSQQKGIYHNKNRPDSQEKGINHNKNTLDSQQKGINNHNKNTPESQEKSAKNRPESQEKSAKNRFDSQKKDVDNSILQAFEKSPMIDKIYIDTNKVLSKNHLRSIIHNEYFINNNHSRVKYRSHQKLNYGMIDNIFWVYLPTVIEYKYDSLKTFQPFPEYRDLWEEMSKAYRFNPKQKFVFDIRSFETRDKNFIYPFSPFIKSQKIPILKSSESFKEIWIGNQDPFLNFEPVNSVECNLANADICFIIDKNTAKIKDIWFCALMYNLSTRYKIYGDCPNEGYVFSQYKVNLDKKYLVRDKLCTIRIPSMQIPSFYSQPLPNEIAIYRK